MRDSPPCGACCRSRSPSTIALSPAARRLAFSRRSSPIWNALHRASALPAACRSSGTRDRRGDRARSLDRWFRASLSHDPLARRPAAWGGGIPRLQLLARGCLLLARQRRRGERLFERLLGLRNDVGLLSEEYDAAGQRLLGNFPQAFSHISLINTAHNLSHETKPAERRGGVQARCGE